ncbi:MAG TPA: hypothetical protein VJA21_24050, partial [Verrucomicrobiae bacterium]
PGGGSVSLTTETLYPGDGKVRITVERCSAPAFCLKLRIPISCALAGLRLNGAKVGADISWGGYRSISRAWKRGDQINLDFGLEPRVVVGDHKNQGKIALLYGPLVLAADQDLLPPGAASDRPLRLNDFAAASAELSSLHFKAEPPSRNFNTWPGAREFRIDAVTRRTIGELRRGSPTSLGLVPFADAGTSGSEYKVWLPLPTTNAVENLLQDGRESRSRTGNLDGSIVDGDPQSAAVTFDGRPAAEDWFTVELDAPVVISRVVFFHGRTFHDGGWFDASNGKPRVQVKTTREGAWEDTGGLKSYPATTDTAAAGLQGGERFEAMLRAPVTVWAVRVIGKPACGDNGRQAFASCAELQAFAK